MKRKAGGQTAEPRGFGRTNRGGERNARSGAETVSGYEIAADDFEPYAHDRDRTRAHDEDAQGALEIEFEDDNSPAALLSPAGRSRDLRPAAMTTLAVAVLGAALWATHGTTAPAPNVSLHFATPTPPPPDYAAFSVTVAYRNAYVVSVPQHRIDVNLRVTPVPGASVRIIAYYVSENGVTARADPPPSVAPLPPAGANVRLELTVTNCATVPIGESMGFVDVVADGPAGVIDRFTILGERYSSDLADLLRQVCPGRASSQAPHTIGVVVAGS